MDHQHFFWKKWWSTIGFNEASNHDQLGWPIWPWYDQQLSKKLLDLQQSHQIKKYSNRSWNKPLLSSLTLVADCLHGVLWLCDIPHARCHWSMKVCQPSKRLGLFRLNVNPPKIQVLVEWIGGQLDESTIVCAPKKTPSIPWSLLGHYKYPPGLLSTWLQYIPTYPNNIPTIVDVCITNTI